jgi:hypothetical protein
MQRLNLIIKNINPNYQLLISAFLYREGQLLDFYIVMEGELKIAIRKHGTFNILTFRD